MTAQQIKWASQHDWFIGAMHDSVEVYDDMEDRAVIFTDFQALRAWAGY